MKAQAVGAPAWLQRPETSRGRRFPAPRPQGVDASASEEKKRSESDGSLAGTKDRRAMDQEVENRGELLAKEKEKRMRLLREQLEREEAEEERRLRGESEERLR